MTEPHQPGPGPRGARHESIRVVVEDDQDDHVVDIDTLRSLAAAALGSELEERAAAGAGAVVATDIEMGLHLVGVDTMATLNHDHMGHEGPTDVLSFPLDLAEPDPAEADPAGPDSDAWVTDAMVLAGDVVLCPAVAAANASSHAGSLEAELALLVVHGVLHLVGHDHAEADERARMQARERTLLADHFGPLPGDPWASTPHPDGSDPTPGGGS